MSLNDYLKAALLASGSFALISAGMLFQESRMQVHQTPVYATNVKNAATTEIDNTRKDLLKKVDDTSDKILKNVQTLADKLGKRIDTLESDTNKQATTLQTNLNNQVSNVVKVVDKQLGETNKNVKTVTDAYAEVPKEIGGRLDIYTNCDVNKLCWQREASNTMFALQASSRSTSQAMDTLNQTLPPLRTDLIAGMDAFKTGFPQIVTNVTGITANIERLTHPHWWERLLGVAVNAGVVYRDIHPADLTIKGAQVISSQK